MNQPLLRTRGAVHAAAPPGFAELVPESVCRENVVCPTGFDGETVAFLALNADDYALADKLRFILAKNVRFTAAPRAAILAAIDALYGRSETESVDSMLCEFTDTSLRDHDIADLASEETMSRGGFSLPRPRSQAVAPRALARSQSPLGSAWYMARPSPSLPPNARSGMFTVTIPEGERVLARHRDGTAQVIVGPKRVWRWGKTFEPMAHYLAHPDQYLDIRFRDGRQEHLTGPAEMWFDPRFHNHVALKDALPLASKEAVVVYSRQGEAVGRRVVYGPAQFVPQPGEWLHTFTWHGSSGGSRGAQKVAKGLIFQKLWMMPDQMYHDVVDVRTADDAVLTVRLMIFFELADVERMLEATHDPIGDFVNAATSDVVEFAGRHTFEEFKRAVGTLNDLATFRQLVGRADRIGYRVSKVVYRGYDTAASLQQMHDQAIEARTRLQLDRATEEQAQQLEDYRLASQLARAGKRRSEQTVEVEHDLGLATTKQAAELRQFEAKLAATLARKRQEAEQEMETRRRQDEQTRDHLRALKEMGVDLTAYLTQARADRVIELRGGKAAHVHLDGHGANGAP